MDKLIYYIKKIINDADIHTVKYIVIGISGVLLDFLLFNLLIRTNIPISFANIISSGIGVANNYYWNSKHNFKKHDNGRMRNFFIVGISGMILSTLLMVVISRFEIIPIAVLKFFVISFVVSIQYLVNRYVTFK